MKTKIKEALVNKYKNLGIDEKVFDGVADMLSKTVTEETQIDSAVTGVEAVLKSFQGATDRLRTENANLKKQIAAADSGNDGKKNDPEPNPKQEPKDDLLALITQLSEKIDAQNEKIESFRAEGNRKNTLDQARAKLVELGIVEDKDAITKKAWSVARLRIGDEDSVDEIVDKVKGEYEELLSIQGEQGYKPLGGEGGSDDDTKMFARLKDQLKSEGIIKE